MTRRSILAAAVVAACCLVQSATAQVTTEVPPVVPGALPVTIEHIKVHGSALEGNAWEVVGIGAYPVIDKLSVYGKLGLYRGELESSGTKETNSDLTYGLGLQYDVIKNVGRLKYAARQIGAHMGRTGQFVRQLLRGRAE